jgi:aldose 1-epimerase
VLDARGVPTGREESFTPFDANLAGHAFDDGFALLADRDTLALSGAGRRVTMELLGGYTHAQVYAPPDADCVALEPMTAPTDALVSGRGLRAVEPGAAFRASFRIGVAAL